MEACFVYFFCVICLTSRPIGRDRAALGLSRATVLLAGKKVSPRRSVTSHISLASKKILQLPRSGGTAWRDNLRGCKLPQRRSRGCDGERRRAHPCLRESTGRSAAQVLISPPHDSTTLTCVAMLRCMLQRPHRRFDGHDDKACFDGIDGRCNAVTCASTNTTMRRVTTTASLTTNAMLWGMLSRWCFDWPRQQGVLRRQLMMHASTAGARPLFCEGLFEGVFLC